MKRIMSILLASGIAFSSFTAFAGEVVASEDFITPYEDAAVKSNEPTTKEMEAMIKKVRPLITIPEDYTVFSWDYVAASVYNTSYWQFSWSNDEKGEIYVTCDNEGRITNFRRYDYNTKRNPALPAVSPLILEEKAREFISKTAPYTNDSQLVFEVQTVGNLYSNTYSYTFLRHENEIPVPSEQITLDINYVTGEVMGMRCSYTTDIDFKTPEIKISEEEAKKILSEHQNMVLSYRLKTEYDDDGNLTSRKAYLVYTPEVGYVSVDAETGEVYTERNTWTVATNAPTLNGASGNIMFDSAAKEESAESERGYQLSEEEMAQLEVLASLITKDEAIKIVTSNKDLYIDPVATVVRANLRKHSGGVRPIIAGEEKTENYVWDIEFSAPETLGNDYPYYYHGMSATVDAKTGELLNFHAQIPDYYYYKETKKEVPELKYTEEKASGIAREFIAKMQPEKSKLVGNNSVSGNTPILYIEAENGSRTPVYGARRFNFVRQNEGLDFTYNNFRIGVELVSGKITDYSYTWYDDVEFESPKDAMSPHDALMSLYFYNVGFGLLNYEINADYTYNEYLVKEKNGEFIDYDALFDKVLYTRAVYSAYDTGTNIIRALDGIMIDYSGEEYSRPNDALAYNDIEAHWAEDTIRRFAWVGIGVDNIKFEPDIAITGEEFKNLCSSIGIYYYNPDAEDSDDAPLSRMDAVVYIIEALGYGKIARLEKVFITDFVDNSDFRDEHVGFAAIARGFGLIEGDGENFRPYDTITRAEAYTIAENMIDLGILNA